MRESYRDEACAEVARVLEEHFKKQCYRRFGIKSIRCERQENTDKLHIFVDHGGRMGAFELPKADLSEGWEMLVIERIDNWLTAVSDRRQDK